MVKEKQTTTAASENAAQSTREEQYEEQVFERAAGGGDEIIGIEIDDVSDEMIHFMNEFSRLVEDIGMTSVCMKMFKAERERVKEATDPEDKKLFERKASFFIENYFAAYERAENGLALLFGEDELSERGLRMLQKAIKVIDQLVIAIVRRGGYREIHRLLLDNNDSEAWRYVLASIMTDEEDE